MKILICGIGIVGKSSFRRRLYSFLSNLCRVNHYDADKFNEARCAEDRNCTLTKADILIIEDVHGTDNEAIFPLSDYDIIFYIKAGAFSHVLFHFSRMWQWFRSGKFAWDRNIEKWKGTGKSYDLSNAIPIFQEFFRDMKNQKKWLREDLDTLKEHKHQIILSRWSLNGPKWIIK